MERDTLMAVGLKAVELLQENVENRKDVITGEKFKPYSFDYWLRKKYKKKSRAKRGSKAYARFLETALGVYADEKDKVDMTDTGNMLSALTVVKVDREKNSFTVGFSNEEAAKVAFYHNVSGAGKGRVLRRWFGLDSWSKESLAKFARDLMVKDADFANDLAKWLKGLG